MASQVQTREPEAPTYEGDAAAWALHQANLLRAGRLDELDIENLADEISSLAKSEFRALTSALTIVLVHLVKWDFQAWERSRSWYHSILEHRLRIADQLRDNPSFKARLDEALEKAWSGVINRVMIDTHMDEREFPIDCPYDWNEIVNRPVVWPLP